MEKQTNSPEDRDTAQRSLGFVGLSALIHVGILIGVALAPSFRTQVGTPAIAHAGEDVSYVGTEVADPAAPAEVNEAPTEVLLADAQDTSAVAMPNTEAQVVETKLVEVAAPVTEEKPVAKIETPKAATKPAPKRAIAPPTTQPKIAVKAAPEVVTDDNSEVAIKAALENARAKKDELPPELDAPQMDESPALETTAVSSDEEAKAATEEVAAALPVEAEEPVKASEEKVEAPVAAVAPTSPAKAEEVPETTSGSTTSAEATEAAQPASATSAAPSTARSASNSSPALTAPNADGAGTLGQSGGGEKGTLGLPAGNSVIRDVRELIALPGNPKPTYPLQDKLARKQGTTILIGKVQANGKVSDIVIEQSSGSRLMDESAAKAFAKWRFRPGQEGMVRSPVQFQLVGEAKELPARLRTQ